MSRSRTSTPAPATMLPTAALATILLASGQAPPAPPPAAAADRYEVSLLTVGHGDAVWERFGHNAIRIRDRLTGQDLAWNWGLFNFADPDFIPRFLRGRMLYSMGPAETGAFLDAYRTARRSVYSNELLLSADEAAELDRLVRENFEPGNRDYLYHYFEDNCSTRVRDILDTVLGGILADAFAGAETDRSYRWHVRRLLGGMPGINHGLSVLIGPRGDAPRSEWDAMFIPMELMRSLEGFERPGGAAGPGALLGPREVLVESGRAAEPAEPPGFAAWWLVSGLGGSALLLAAGRRAAAGHRSSLRLLALSATAWCAAAGLLGALLLGLWFTDHTYGRWNVNILHLSPIALLTAALLAAGSWRRGWERRRVGRAAAGLAAGVALLSAAGAALELLTPFSQGNAEVLAVALPLNAAAAIALRKAARAGAAGGGPGSR